jgi:type I restriction-modification system DNA methylase subunit
LLGYTRPAHGHARYTISWEKHVEVDGKFADAVLGDFNGEHRYVVALEGKGPRDPLDRPYAGRRMSAVDQGFRYAINLKCDWVVVTSMRQTRLYHKGSDQQTYERFDTEQLAEDEVALRRFVFLLGAERVVPEVGRCHLYGLHAESEKVGRELTKKFYVDYANMRQDAFERLSADNQGESRHDVLSSTQKLLDRVLFVAFSEDRGLLPTESIKKAFEHRDPYHPRPIWDNFRGLFNAINHGNAALGIHKYNGGLFADDAVMDRLLVSDDVCEYFHELGSYDYRPAHLASGEGSLIDVDILGHIFEQSITDLEKLRNELDGLVEPLGAEKHKTRRKKEGAFYTPSFITRYIIEQALGGVLRDRFEELRAEHQKTAKGAAKAALADPAVYELSKLTKPARAALVTLWEAWQDALVTIRLLDPACGSGAFLIEAFDQLHAAYQRSNDRLLELRGHRSLFDLDRRILENNLYGVDLNEEAIEICRLSLWIKTAERGKTLASLDHAIRVGNSVVSDLAVHPKAFDWQAAFPEVFAQGGFDVVVGNPPYVRQELLSSIKPYLQTAYRAYHGMADLYVCFYELGLRVLRPGGLLSFIVTNKWMKSGYGEPLRRFFAEETWVESVVDFGHAKQIFEDADVFPSIIVARKPTKALKPNTARLCSIPREQLRVEDLSRQIEAEGVELSLDQLGANTWQLEPDGVNRLIAKIAANGSPLSDQVGVQLFRGVVTGCNDAFLIDGAKRRQIVEADPASADIIMPYVRGQDIERWSLDWQDLWMIFTRRGITIDHYPGVRDHLQRFRAQLEPRPKGWIGNEWPGRKPGTYQWFEIQDSIDYWQEFSKPKILYQDIAWRPQYCLDRNGRMSNNTVHFIVSDDLWLLAVLNSAAAWWYSWRSAQHGKDEALRLFSSYMRIFPVPMPDRELRESATKLVEKLCASTNVIQVVRRAILDWLRVEHNIEKAGLKLQSPTELDSDAFVAEVKRVRGKKNPLSAAALKSLRDEYTRTIDPARAEAAEALRLERQLSDLVNEAYGLTPEEVALMWQTAPPRMPLAGP